MVQFAHHCRCIIALASLLFCQLLITPTYAAGPILVGQNTLAPVADSDAAGTAEAFRVTASATGQVVSLSAYIAASSAATQLVLGIYSDNSGTPGSLLRQGLLASPTKGAWNAVPIQSTNVVAGAVYWVAILSPAGTGKIAFLASGSAGGRSETSRTTNLTTLPTTWTTGAVWNSSPASVYGSGAQVPTPVLSVAPASLMFTAIQGGANPTPASLSITNTGSGTLSFTASGNQSWLTLAPTSGTAPQSVQANVASSTLAAGVYSGAITVTAAGAQGSPASIPVSLNVTTSNPPPSGSDWLTYGHDPQRTGNAAGETIISPTSIASLSQKWAALLDGKITAQPLFVSGIMVNSALHDVVIAATNANSIYAVDAATGATLWRRNFGASLGSGAIPGGIGISGTPVIDRARGLIFAVSDDGNLRTIRLADGAFANPAQPALPVIVDSLSQPTLSNVATNSVWGGLNLVGANLYIATASDGNDSAPWWGRILRVDTSRTDISGALSPALTGWFKIIPSLALPNAGGGAWGYGGVAIDSLGRVVAATSADSNEGYAPYGARLVALGADLGYSVATSPWGGVLGSYEPPHPATCLGAPGVCDWDFGATPVIFQPPGCSKPLAAAANKDGHIYVLPVDDLATSSTTALQSLALNNPFDGPGLGGITGVPAYWPAGNMLFITDGGQGVAGVKAGVVGMSVNCNNAPNYLQVAWSAFLPAANEQPPSPPTVANGVVFVGSGLDGTVHAYNATTGVELGNSGTTITGMTFAAPTVANGVVYVASWNGFGVSDAGTLRAFSSISVPPPPPPPPPNVLLGDRTVEASLDSNGLGSAEAFSTTATASGSVVSLYIYLDATSTATGLTAGLYTDSGANAPSQLIAQGSASGPLTAGAWNKISVPGATVSAGTKYWIAILGTQSGGLKFRDSAAGGCSSQTSAQNNLTSLPLSWSTGAVWAGTCLLSAYGSSVP